MSKQQLTILFIGDIIGSYGRAVTKKMIPILKSEEHIDLIIANGENSAAGYGITEKVCHELTEAGIDVFTMGNHMWDRRDIISKIKECPNIVRPANYPAAVPGKTYLVAEKSKVKVGIFNLCGRVFMPALDCPFKTAEKIAETLKPQTNIIIADFHAEATSEKEALGFHLDGQVSAVLGTHTHVQTADERILPGGTAYITDVGMVGAEESVIGMNKEQILLRFLTQLPHKFEVEKRGPAIFNAVILKIDIKTGKAASIKRIYKRLAEEEVKPRSEEQ